MARERSGQESGTRRQVELGEGSNDLAVIAASAALSPLLILAARYLYIALGGTIGLAVMAYRAQKKLWRTDMQAKQATEIKET